MISPTPIFITTTGAAGVSQINQAAPRLGFVNLIHSADVFHNDPVAREVRLFLLDETGTTGTLLDSSALNGGGANLATNVPFALKRPIVVPAKILFSATVPGLAALQTMTFRVFFFEFPDTELESLIRIFG